MGCTYVGATCGSCNFERVHTLVWNCNGQISYEPICGRGCITG